LIKSEKIDFDVTPPELRERFLSLLDQRNQKFKGFGYLSKKKLRGVT